MNHFFIQKKTLVDEVKQRGDTINNEEGMDDLVNVWFLHFPSLVDF